MKNFFAEVLKLSLVGILILFGFIAVVAFMDESFEDAYIDRQEYGRSWLNKLKSEDEKEFTADYLSEICTSNREAQQSFCTGYMLGFVEGKDMAPIFTYCGNENLRSSKQSIQAFENFMEANPQHWEKSRAAVLGGALQDAFPCSDPVSP